MHRANHQVAGQSGLDGHFGRGQVSDFADHDNVRVLPQQRAQSFRKREADARLNLALIERGLDHFNRVFDGVDVDFVGSQTFQRGVKGGGFARTRWTGHQDNAVVFAG